MQSRSHAGSSVKLRRNISAVSRNYQGKIDAWTPRGLQERLGIVIMWKKIMQEGRGEGSQEGVQ